MSVSSGAALVADYVFAPRMDWCQIMRDLAEHGCSPHRVSVLLGAHWSTVQNWRDDPKAELGYGYGRALLRLHSRFCGAALTTRRQYESERRM